MDENKNSKTKWILFLICLVCIIIWCFGIFGTHWYANRYAHAENDILTNPALFGDSAGLINALFSAFALIGVIIAIFLQKNELELQRQELKATTAELKNQKKEFEVQNETLKKQRFENTFFQMMSLQQEITSGLSYIYYEKEVVGKDNDGQIIDKDVQRTVSSRELFYYFYKQDIINTLNPQAFFLLMRNCFFEEKTDKSERFFMK